MTRRPAPRASLRTPHEDVAIHPRKRTNRRPPHRQFKINLVEHDCWKSNGPRAGDLLEAFPPGTRSRPVRHINRPPSTSGANQGEYPMVPFTPSAIGATQGRGMNWVEEIWPPPPKSRSKHTFDKVIEDIPLLGDGGMSAALGARNP